MEIVLNDKKFFNVKEYLEGNSEFIRPTKFDTEKGFILDTYEIRSFEELEEEFGWVEDAFDLVELHLDHFGHMEKGYLSWLRNIDINNVVDIASKFSGVLTRDDTDLYDYVYDYLDSGVEKYPYYFMESGCNYLVKYINAYCVDSDYTNIFLDIEKKIFEEESDHLLRYALFNYYCADHIDSYYDKDMPKIRKMRIGYLTSRVDRTEIREIGDGIVLHWDPITEHYFRDLGGFIFCYNLEKSISDEDFLELLEKPSTILVLNRAERHIRKNKKNKIEL